MKVYTPKSRRPTDSQLTNNLAVMENEVWMKLNKGIYWIKPNTKLNRHSTRTCLKRNRINRWTWFSKISRMTLLETLDASRSAIFRKLPNHICSLTEIKSTTWPLIAAIMPREAAVATGTAIPIDHRIKPIAASWFHHHSLLTIAAY